MKKYFWHILFALALLIISYYYNYHEIVFKRPQSVHKWRQSDCASIALNYYQNGMNFFQPETHNLTSDGGTSGKACTSEIPILYYTVAALYKVFAYNESIFRILNMLLFFLGLFYLFRLLKNLLHDGFWAISLTLLFFTSPVLVFYANNFISNSSSLAFSIVGWYYFFRFYNSGKQKWFTVSILTFLFAATFKVSALFSLFAIGGIYLVEILGISKLKTTKLFNQPIKQLLIMIAAVGIVFSWILYARFYNQKHDCTYFSTTIFPIWSIDKAEVFNVLDHIRNLWLAQYFHLSVLIFLFVCLLFIIVWYKKNLKILNIALAIIFCEVVVYVLLQFWTFKDHDYYTIDMYILPVIILASTFYTLKVSFNKFFSRVITKVVFAVFVLFNIYYAQKMNTERYEGWMNNYGQVNDSYTITSYLRELGISANDTIISIPDGSHVSLYLMNQKGWTEYRDARLNREEPIPYNWDSIGIQNSIDKGARYLIVNGINQLYEKPYLQSFCFHAKGRYNNIIIFDLLAKETNFNLKNRIVFGRYFCGAEILNENKKQFVGSPDSTLFRNGETQSTDFAFDGKYSCKVGSKTPYGFTVVLKNLKFGESFNISVWRKITSKGTIIASSSDYYNSEFEIIETKDGWEKLEKELFVSKELERKDLSCYLYNSEEEAAYFDDFEIIRYKSAF